MAGLTAVSISIIAALLLVSRFVFDLAIGITVTAVVAAVALITWCVVPLHRRSRGR